MGKPYKPRELQVVVDTNVIFSLGLDADVSKSELQRAVGAHRSYPDLKVRWFIPDVVRSEREYQLKNKARELLPAILKAEHLLDRKLPVSEDDLVGAAETLLERQLTALTIQPLPLDHRRVAWKAVCDDAVKRRPPFSPSPEKEKGFRDALIVQTFLQFAASSEEDPEKCLFVLVSNDELVQAAITSAMSERKNIRFSRKLPDLDGLVHTLLAKVDEALIEELRSQAAKIFFEEQNPNSIYYKEQVEARLREKFSKELAAIPTPAVPAFGVTRENGTWAIYHPNFSKKEGQRITWISQVFCTAKAFTPAFRPPDPAALEQASNIYLRPKPGEPSWVDMVGAFLLGLSQIKMEMRHIMNGKASFEVAWSADLADDRSLRNPKVEGLAYLSTEWT